ncbi:hypothetical protein CONPUDRAFT_158009 [Coniophora puteana RWD-64-598 SS2]|uniref:CsbD-like domain-containing protein n=1 Tax=Coniophora puteana (strain RWD-64-598) TaxID=741705 RepID=A0A5M3ME09_CONPW|nr:uncharacterized protein CONPUDRAFT_158009 [Coniophora puteana RWD-64-598 SS2]EIW76855.1 hypothetical protein CONPUDRAFT_158009 [Coniophora puteana RWD-64-598 SS2]
MSFDNTNNAGLNATRPSHTIHCDSEPLPGSGARSAAQASDYSPATIDRTPSSALHDTTAPTEVHVNQQSREREQSRLNESFDGTSSTMSREGPVSSNSEFRDDGAPEPPSKDGVDAFSSERSMDSKPSNESGVAVGGDDDLPEGKAGMADKMIGKTQKVMGKVTKKPELQEKGELREVGGKAAVQGEARVPHE